MRSSPSWRIVADNALAQINVTFDEYGVGTFNNTPLPYGIAVEPLSGLSTLAYQLPFPVADGDLFLTEGTAVPPINSDLVRFGNIQNTAGTFGVAYFFSDPLDPSDIGNPLADNPFGVPPPNAVGLPVLYFPEGGVEGNDGLVYTPNGGDPGNFPGALVTYTILSDSNPAPEPSTFVLLGISAIGLLAYAWRRRRS